MAIDVDLLAKICEVPGAPGFEIKIRELVIKELKGLVDDIRVDRMGNVIALKKGKDSSKKAMAAAHMDEIGFIVTHIDDDGFVRFNPLGGFDAKTLTSQRVLIHGKKDVRVCVGACEFFHKPFLSSVLAKPSMLTIHPLATRKIVHSHFCILSTHPNKKALIPMDEGSK